MCWCLLWFFKNSVYPNSQIRIPKGSKNPTIMNIEVFWTLIRQIWIWPVPQEAKQCHLQFGNLFSTYFHNNKEKTNMHYSPMIFRNWMPQANSMIKNDAHATAHAWIPSDPVGHHRTALDPIGPHGSWLHTIWPHGRYRGTIKRFVKISKLIVGNIRLINGKLILNNCLCIVFSVD